MTIITTFDGEEHDKEELLIKMLDDDFYYDVTTNGIKISPEELRLLYVACTRAQNNLDIANIAPLISGLQTGKKVIYGS